MAIVKNGHDCQKLQICLKWSKCSKVSKIVKNVKNYQKIVKILKYCQNWRSGHVISSLWSNVSMVSDKVTYCCQTLLWTAKKTRTMSMTNFIDQKLFAKCKMHFCMQWLLEWQLFYIGVTPVVKSSGGVDEIPRLLVCPKSVDDDDCMHALTGWRGVNCSLSLA